jgi:enediyne biosynthesis protein E4
LSGDAAWDIAVGNDFGLPDAFWTRQAGAWTPFQPFTALTYSTMSFDVGDVNNDGQQDFFAADMNPLSDDRETTAAYAPVLDRIKGLPRAADDLQIMTNTLHIQEAEGYVNRAEAWGVAASGWAWSSKFGDLDSDGWLDLYSVNGMIAEDLLNYLSHGELKEHNQAFHNVGGRFVPAPEWKLDAQESGRGMSMADLDDDGDLDIVVSNLQAASTLFENQLCGGNNLLVTLQQAGTNPDAIGARLTLHTSAGISQREVRAASGYLSGDPVVVHFGIPAGSQLYSLVIDWPDGTQSRVDNLSSNTHLTLQHL